jgi:ribosome-associated protein
MQYIGKLMRKVDAAPIRAALDAFRAGPRREAALHKRVDSWRERLLADADSIHELRAEYPAADAQQLQTLIQDTLSERKAGRPPRAFRALYHALHALLDKA